MKKRKIKEFIEQAKKYDIRYWNITHCPEHYKTIYYEIIDNKVWINHCPKCAIQPRKKSSWKTIADNFNSFKSPQDITSANKWWKFEEPIDLDVKIELFEFFFSAGMSNYDLKNYQSFYLDEIKPFVFNLLGKYPNKAIVINLYAYKGDLEYFIRRIEEAPKNSQHNFIVAYKRFSRKDLLKSKDKMELSNWVKKSEEKKALE
jgi:hypothetical protein